MTTTGTRRPSAAPQQLLMALLAAFLFCEVAAGPALADSVEAPTPNGAASVIVPEPGTLIFVGAAGLALFARRRKQLLR